MKKPGLEAKADPFPYGDYEAARTALRRAIGSGHVFASLEAPSGAGKSTLVRQLAPELESSRVQILYVSSSSASTYGLLNTLARALRVPPLRSCLETSQLVASALKGAPVRYALWLDEADEVSSDTLREVRILAEADLTSSQILSVVLSGLPALRAVLDAPELFPLKRRIALRLKLTGLSKDELDPFLSHRFGGGPRAGSQATSRPSSSSAPRPSPPSSTRSFAMPSPAPKPRSRTRSFTSISAGRR